MANQFIFCKLTNLGLIHVTQECKEEAFLSCNTEKAWEQGGQGGDSEKAGVKHNSKKFPFYTPYMAVLWICDI